MATTQAALAKALSKHAPSIKFRYALAKSGGNHPSSKTTCAKKKNTAGQTLTAHAVSATPGSHALAAGLLSSSSSSQQQLSRKGKPLLSQSLPLITENTPAKYKPAPLTAIEIEAVMSGGAVF